MFGVNVVFRGGTKLRDLWVRSYALKSDLKIKWVRPVKIPSVEPVKSGDLVPLHKVNLNEAPLELKSSRELTEADDLVKRVLSLNFHPRSKAMEVARLEMASLVQRHELDYDSMEVKIALMTARIRSLQEIFAKYPRSVKVKVTLKEMIEKRKKYLKFLRQQDYKRFEWLLEKLDLVYKAPPSKFHWITRKESLEKLTTKYCEDLKRERLAAYRKTLQDQQASFLNEKIEKLIWIRQEEIACKVNPTVSEEDINEARKQLQELNCSNKEAV